MNVTFDHMVARVGIYESQVERIARLLIHTMEQIDELAEAEELLRQSAADQGWPVDHDKIAAIAGERHTWVARVNAMYDIYTALDISDLIATEVTRMKGEEFASEWGFLTLYPEGDDA